MATRDDQQPRDQWGNALQNEYGRILSDIARKQDSQGEMLARMSERSDHRDQKVKEIADRQASDAHRANNFAQTLTARVEKLQVSSDTVDKRVEQVTVEVAGLKQSFNSLEGRTAALEAPFKEAIIAREKRWARYRRWGGWLFLIIATLWTGVAEPVWRGVAPIFLQRFFSSGPPP